MFIRYYVYSDNEKDSYEIHKDTIKIIRSEIKSEKVRRIMPYWKIEELYVVEVDLKFKSKLKKELKKIFLESISDNWTFFNMGEEALASENSPKTFFIKKDICLIDIYFDEKE